MHAHKRGSTWRYEFRHGGRKGKGGQPDVPAKRYRRGGFATKALALEAGRVEQRRVRSARLTRIWGVMDSVERAAATPTLDRYVAEVYTPLHLPRLEASTQTVVRSVLRKLVRILGDVTLDQLGHAAMDKLLATRLEEGVTHGQIAQEVGWLSRVVNHARARGVIDEHPFRGWKRPRAAWRDYRVVTREEEAALMKAAGPFAIAIRLALYAGLRKGEIRTLERSALVDGELRLRQPKTKRVKVIPLDEETWGMLAARICSAGRESAEGRGNPIINPPAPPRASSPYLLATRSGKPYSLPWFDQAWQETRERAGIVGRLRFHDLRHTFASRLAEHASVPTVGELMGHRPPYTMTLRYFHVLEDAKREAVRRLAMGEGRAGTPGGRSSARSGDR